MADMEALRTRQDRVRFVQVRHEEAAAFMACAWAKFTGRLGVCLATSGPGGIHLLNGLYDAKLDNQPVLDRTADETILRRLGLTVDVLDAGCCGMAGAFGFERDHYDVSLAMGEHGVLPAVRAAAADTLIVADGFSCREQIEQVTGRRTVHLADVLHRALGGPDGAPATQVDGDQRPRMALPAAVTAAVLVFAGVLMAARRPR
jgi:hypothetical protein